MTDSTENTPEGGFYLKLSTPDAGSYRKSVDSLLNPRRRPVEVFRAANDSTVMALGQGLTTNDDFAKCYKTREEALADAKVLESDTEGMARLSFKGGKGGSKGIIEWRWTDGPLNVEEGAGVVVSKLSLKTPSVAVWQGVGVAQCHLSIDRESGQIADDDVCYLDVIFPGREEPLKCQVNAQEFVNMQQMLERKFEVVEGLSARAEQFVFGAQVSDREDDMVWLSEEYNENGLIVNRLTRDFEEIYTHDGNGWDGSLYNLPHACVAEDLPSGYEKKCVMVVEKGEEGQGYNVELLEEDGSRFSGVMEQVLTKRTQDGSVRTIAHVLVDRVNPETGCLLKENEHYEIPADFMQGLEMKACERHGSGVLEYEVMDVGSANRILGKAQAMEVPKAEQAPAGVAMGL